MLKYICQRLKRQMIQFIECNDACFTDEMWCDVIDGCQISDEPDKN